MRYVLILIIASLVYFQGIKPVIADRFYYLYKSGDKDAIKSAVDWAPDNSLYRIETGDVQRVINTHNGDLTTYSLWYLRGVQLLQRGDQSGVDCMRLALRYYPDFTPAQEIIKQVEAASGKK